MIEEGIYYCIVQINNKYYEKQSNVNSSDQCQCIGRDANDTKTGSSLETSKRRVLVISSRRSCLLKSKL